MQNPEKLLLIKAKGGLGNRILSAVCGLTFADLTGRTPVIDWRDGSYANLGENAYPLLFETPISLTCDARDNDLRTPSPAIWKGHIGLTPQAMIDLHFPQSHASPLIYRKLCTDLSRINTPEETAIFWCYLPKFTRLRRHLRRHAEFANQPVHQIIQNYLTEYFTPNARVRERIAAALAQMPRPIIGVHIRYTDRKVPLDKVRSALQRQLEAHPTASIFLATDNAHIQAEMAAEFKNIFHTPKYLDAEGKRLHSPDTTFDKVLEAENALVDIWLLSQCDHLIHSRHSTFSELSSILGGLSGPRRDDVDRSNPYVLAKRLIQHYA